MEAENRRRISVGELDDTDLCRRRGKERGDEGKQAILALIAALAPQGFSSFALEAIAPDGEDEITALVNALQSPDSGVRYEAACVLAGIGSNAKAAASLLLKVLGDPEEKSSVREKALLALANILGDVENGLRDTIMSSVIKALDEGDEWVRKPAMAILMTCGKHAEEALMDLVNEWSDDSSRQV